MKRSAKAFLDIEARVDDEEEEEDDDEAEFASGAGFISDDEQYEVEEAIRASSRHLDLDRMRHEDNDVDLEEQAAMFDERYGRHRSASKRAIQAYQNNTPQKLLMPDVNSPHLWMIKSKPGAEQGIVITLMRRFLDADSMDTPLDISSACCRKRFRGYFYIESSSRKAVEQVSKFC